VDIVLIQETKLAKNDKTPKLNGYAAVRKDRKLIRKAKTGREEGY
jgi:hypothetical protein